MFLAKKAPVAPLYSTLSGVELILDATGLRWNTNNSYGTVDSVGSVSIWKSIAPGPTGRDFSALGLGPATSGSPGILIDGYINFGGSADYVSNSANTTWNFLSYNAVATNTKSTIHMVCKFGNESNPDWMYGFVGNNATSGGYKGWSVRYEDRSVFSRSNGLSQILGNGSGSILSANPNDVLTPNQVVVLTFETDLSQVAADRFKAYINNTQISFSATSPSTSVVNTPNNALRIGSTGLGVYPLFGWVSHVIIQSVIESSGTRGAFIQSLLPYTIRKANQYWRVDESRTYVQATFLDENSYYLNVAVEKNPVTGNILCVFGNWTSAGHTYSEDNFVAFRKSTGDVTSWTAKAAAFSPGDDRGAIDCGFFFDTNGVGHGFVNTMDGAGTTSTPGTSKLFYFSTSDDGDNWINSEITVPSDGLEFTAGYGNGYTANGFNWYCVYRQTTDTTSSARYILKWALGANISTIEWILVESGSTYINEGSIAYLGGNSHVLICRNESTNEWTQYYTDDNWATNTNQGNQTFGGESNTVPGPVRIAKFPVYSNGIATDILKCYYPLRGTSVLKAIYARPSNIISSGLTGWDTDTKETIVTDTQIIHYGGAYHDGFNFFAVFTRESTTDLSTLISFRGPTNLHATVKAQLGL